MADERQYCTFYLDGHYFGVDVLKVQEVIRYQEMTRVPLAPPVVRGLINLRGQIVTAIDLRRRLDLPDRPADQLPVNVVVQTDDGAVSLLVDEIGDVLRGPGDGVRAAAGDAPGDGPRADPRGVQAGRPAAADPRHRARRPRRERRRQPVTTMSRAARRRSTRVRLRPVHPGPSWCCSSGRRSRR